MTTQPNNPDRPPQFDSELIDMHLGALDAARREALKARLQRDPQLARQNATLEDAFAALSASRGAIEAPANLAQRVVARVGALGSSPRVVGSSVAKDEWSERVIRLSGLRDMIAVAAMVVLAVGLGVPSLLHMRERGQRIACAQNMARIGQAVGSYTTQFNDDLPFAGWTDHSSWRPRSEPGVEVVPNRRHLYPLVAAGFLPTQVFVCPSGHDVAMPASQIRTHNDFLESRNISYASQNMAGVRPARAAGPSVVFLADDNPLFDDGTPLLSEAAARLGLADPAKGNSRAHGGVGQNVLRLDGRSEWATHPAVGAGGDNIWTLQGVEIYSGREGPRSATDSHLLK